jgi:hypothetical protein
MSSFMKSAVLTLGVASDELLAVDDELVTPLSGIVDILILLNPVVEQAAISGVAIEQRFLCGELGLGRQYPDLEVSPSRSRRALVVLRELIAGLAAGARRETGESIREAKVDRY